MRDLSVWAGLFCVPARPFVVLETKKSYNVRYFTCLFGGSALSQYLCCRNHDVKQYVSSHTVDGEFVQVPLAQLQNNQVLN